jgi:hypothetical protein
MKEQRDLHEQALTHLSEIERIIDRLKNAGRSRLDGWNALKNVEEHLIALAGRCDVERITK